VSFRERHGCVPGEHAPLTCRRFRETELRNEFRSDTYAIRPSL